MNTGMAKPPCVVDPPRDVGVATHVPLNLRLLRRVEVHRGGAVVERPQSPVPGLGYGQPAHVAGRVAHAVANVLVHPLDGLRPPLEHLGDGAVLVEPLLSLVPQLQPVVEGALLVGGLVPQDTLVGLVHGTQVRVEDLDELPELVGGLAA